MLNLKPIKTEADYEQALLEIESLFDAPLGTPEGDKLEILVTLVEVYEEKSRRSPCQNLVSRLCIF